MRNPYHKDQWVLFKEWCGNPLCKCKGHSFIGRTGIVRTTKGGYVKVEFGEYEDLAERIVNFKKETAPMHLEPIRKPTRTYRKQSVKEAICRTS